MFIIGFGRKTFEVLGESKKRVCKSCNNERKFKYVRERAWVTLFFIPLFAYKSRKILICPVCSMGFENKGDIEILPLQKPKTQEDLKKDRESKFQLIKKKFDNGELSKNEYIRMCNILNYEIKTSH